MDQKNIAVILLVFAAFGLGISVTSIYYRTNIVLPTQEKFDNYKKAVQPMLNPSVLEIWKDGDYTCVNVTSIHVTVFRSLSSSEAVQWALDNVWNYTEVTIMDDILMDGEVNCPHNKSYSVRAVGGHLIYNMTID